MTELYMGGPCKNGHSGRRYKQNQECVECRAVRNKSPQSREYAAAYQRRPHRKKDRTERYRKKTYDLTPIEYNFMLAGQQYRCFVCRSEEPGGTGYWHTDHIHGTKIVRGILCHGCNTAIGHCKESPAILRALADYIEQHQSCQTPQTNSPTQTDATVGQSNHWPNIAQVETQYIPLSLAM